MARVEYLQPAYTGPGCEFYCYAEYQLPANYQPPPLLMVGWRHDLDAGRRGKPVGSAKFSEPTFSACLLCRCYDYRVATGRPATCFSCRWQHDFRCDSRMARAARDLGNHRRSVFPLFRVFGNCRRDGLRIELRSAPCSTARAAVARKRG